MTKTTIFAIATLTGLFLVTVGDQTAFGGINILPIGDSLTTGNTPIPDWVDQNFIWYGQGQIEQSELLNAMKFLLDNNIMYISEEAAIEVQELREENQKLKALIDEPPPEPEIKLVPTPGALPELPGFCPDSFEPVCGDDGKTYDNKCRAEQADVEIDYRGECESCPRIYDPVCGDDGKTYENQCLAHQNGAGIEHEGECRDGPEPECPRGYVWLECAQMCIPLGGDRVCPDGYSWSEHSMSCTQDSDGVCPDHYDPVCGVDGNSYSNACEATLAEVEIDYEGQCLDECTSNDQCTDDLVCRDGVCQGACSIQCVAYDPVCGDDGVTYGCGIQDAACHGIEVAYDGECKELLCTAVYDPVCGTDGKTYGNECEATKAGVEISYEGQCLTRAP